MSDEAGDFALLFAGRCSIYIVCPPALMSAAYYRYRPLPLTIERAAEGLRRQPVALQQLRHYAFRHPGIGVETGLSDDELIKSFIRSVRADRLRAIPVLPGPFRAH